MFTAAIFTIARTWKQPRYPSTDECIKMWYIYTMDYYLAIKRNGYESVVVRCPRSPHWELQTGDNISKHQN